MSKIILPALSSTIDPIPSASKLDTNININISKRHRSASLSCSLELNAAAVTSAAVKPPVTWGRRDRHGSWLHSLGCASVMVLAPCLVLLYQITLFHFSGSLTEACHRLWLLGFSAFVHAYAPRPTFQGSLVYVLWLLFQIILFQQLPGKVSSGQLTPAGHLLQYRTNGFLAWLVTHVLWAALSVNGILDPALLAKHWGPQLVAMNVAGFLLTGFAFVKAHVFPSHERDRKFSGSVIYDLYMGIELNPRIGRYFDLKLFVNGRPGIVAWTLIDLSFIAHQYQLHGYITNSILLSTALHSIYVLDFFVNEDWYLRTIDICHDHFGFYLAWGSLVWLPAMYTLQTQYLAINPIVLQNTYGFSIFTVGICGYVLFRSVNHQKDVARRTHGKCRIWGKPAKMIQVSYKTADGMHHESMLLCSGWWGLARHVNYAGDLILSFSMCAACGTMSFLPWFYALFMTVLLVHRCWRDEIRCRRKYGDGWEKYCECVPWVICPGVW